MFKGKLVYILVNKDSIRQFSKVRNLNTWWNDLNYLNAPVEFGAKLKRQNMTV